MPAPAPKLVWSFAGFVFGLEQSIELDDKGHHFVRVSFITDLLGHLSPISWLRCSRLWSHGKPPFCISGDFPSGYSGLKPASEQYCSCLHFPSLRSAHRRLKLRQLASPAVRRRPRCGLVRGCPLCSSHCSLGSAPQVGHGTAWICSMVGRLESRAFLACRIRSRSSISPLRIGSGLLGQGTGRLDTLSHAMLERKPDIFPEDHPSIAHLPR